MNTHCYTIIGFDPNAGLLTCGPDPVSAVAGHFPDLPPTPRPDPTYIMPRKVWARDDHGVMRQDLAERRHRRQLEIKLAHLRERDY